MTKLNMKQTIFLSLGFFASLLLWTMYNTNVPLLLEEFVYSSTAIGFIMSIDNFFGVIFQPLFGKISDRTRTRFGRRLPFMFVCMPICALLFIFIPHMAHLWSLMAVVIVFTFMMSLWRTPAVSIMADVTPWHLHSQGNGIVNLMGGIGAIIALGAGGVLYGLGGFSLMFFMVAVVTLVSVILMAVFVREPEYPPVEPGERLLPAFIAEKIFRSRGMFDKTKAQARAKLSKPEFKSLVLLLCAIFFWFMAYNAVETFFSRYAVHTLGVDAGQANMLLSLFAGALVLFAVPAGYIGAKFGRRKTVLSGLCGLILAFFPLIFIENTIVLGGLLLLGGMCWACININALPMVVRIAGPKKIGTFIGYYYLFSFSAQLITTPIYGLIHDLVGNFQSLFVYACVTLAFAVVLLFFVRHGENPEEAVI